jgi:hypothetical protein
MTKVDADGVSTIIVKSLDRMGRNYLESGMLRELFAEKKIRLIAVNDGIDTFDREDDFVPFREIMAEYYARDTSRKIKSVLHAKGRDGKPLAAVPPYGFIKDPEDKNRWIIDEESASVVRRIFQMTVDGKGPSQIARILHDEQVPRPSYYLTLHNQGNHRANCDFENPYSWSGNSVAHILSYPAYAGHLVNFKTKRPSFKSKKCEYTDSSEWAVFENALPAIVPQGTWDLAQKLRETTRRTDSIGEANPLTGLLYCFDCKSKMYNHRGGGKSVLDIRNGKKYTRAIQDTYSCSKAQLSIRRFEPECSLHHISTPAVREIILTTIKKTSSYVIEHEAEFVKKLRESSAVRQGETVKSHRRAITKNERRVAELDKLYKSLYENFVKGLLIEERFKQMSEDYEREKAELKAQNATLQSELDAFNADSENADRFIELVRRYTRFEELTTGMINEFIERVEIHEGEWSEKDPTSAYKGQRSQTVDVYLKYIGKFDVPDSRTSEELEAERAAEEKRQRIRASNRKYMRRKYAEAKAEKQK